MNNTLRCSLCLQTFRRNFSTLRADHYLSRGTRMLPSRLFGQKLKSDNHFPLFGKARQMSATAGLDSKHKTVLLYLSSAAILAGGLSYAAVPLYRLYCQASGYGSAKQEIDFGKKIENMERIDERMLTIRFEAGTSKTLRWKFKPQQKEVKLAPGETALAFYTAENLTNEPIIGIATYNVIPFDAGQYFNKIQCFCFEEQQLNPGEEVDMPVFFYIDPEIMEDPKLAKYDELILSYTFFQSNDSNAPGASPHLIKPLMK